SNRGKVHNLSRQEGFRGRGVELSPPSTSRPAVAIHRYPWPASEYCHVPGCTPGGWVDRPPRWRQALPSHSLSGSWCTRRMVEGAAVGVGGTGVCVGVGVGGNGMSLINRACDLGSFPTAIVSMTLSVAVSITDTVSLNLLTTYTCVPSGVTSSP